MNLDDATIHPFGEGALVVEFGDTVDPAIQARVHALAAVVDAAPPPGVLEVVPTFRSLLVEFDPDVSDAATILDEIAARGAGRGRAGAEAPRREWVVPVRIDAEAAEDAGDAAGELGIDVATLHERLLASRLTVGMYGFVPGNCYMTGVDPSLTLPRRLKPRPPVPPGSLIIAVGQAVFLPVSMPTGWYVVGRTSARMFDPGSQPPVPFAIGDTIRLRAVRPVEFDALAARPDGGVEEA